MEVLMEVPMLEYKTEYEWTYYWQEYSWKLDGNVNWNIYLNISGSTLFMVYNGSAILVEYQWKCNISGSAISAEYQWNYNINATLVEVQWKYNINGASMGTLMRIFMTDFPLGTWQFCFWAPLVLGQFGWEGSHPIFQSARFRSLKSTPA